MSFNAGDFVKVKPGVRLPGWEYSFAGWQGRVIDVHSQKEIFEIELDGPTLQNMPDKYLVRCIADSSDPLNIYFRLEDLESASSRESVETLEKTQEELIQRMGHLDPSGDWEEDYDMQINRWCRNFRRSKFYDRLSPLEQKHAPFIIHAFSNSMWEYYGVAPARWEEEDVENCLLDEVPERLSAPPEVFTHFAPVLICFLEFLHSRKYLPTLFLQDTIEEIQEEIPKRAADSSSWSLAKQFAMKVLQEENQKETVSEDFLLAELSEDYSSPLPLELDNPASH